MQKNKFTIVLIALFALPVYYGCDNKQIGTEVPELPDIPTDTIVPPYVPGVSDTTLYPLTGTQWKLVGIMNRETGKLKELLPTDCGECYTFSFISDSSAYGWSMFLGTQIVDIREKHLGQTGLTLPAEQGGEGPLYREALYSVDSYKVSPELDTLKFFYADYVYTQDQAVAGYDRKYLLYKRTDLPDTASLRLAGTRWKLSGLVDTETGILEELEPTGCKECYTFSFITNYMALGQDIRFPMWILDIRKKYLGVPPLGGHGIGVPVREELEENETTYRWIVYASESYYASPGLDELRLISNTENKYLLYKRTDL